MHIACIYEEYLMVIEEVYIYHVCNIKNATKVQVHAKLKRTWYLYSSAWVACISLLLEVVFPRFHACLQVVDGD